MNDLNEEGSDFFTTVEHTEINPKSIHIDSLYGFSDTITKEWNEGIFAHTFKRYS